MINCVAEEPKQIPRRGCSFAKHAQGRQNDNKN